MTDDDQAMRAVADDLANAIDVALPKWIEHSIVERAGEKAIDLRVETAAAAVQAQAEILPPIHELLAQDIDAQPTTPMAILRLAVVYPTRVLQQAQIDPVERDAYARERFPDDIYDLTPANFGDIDEALAEPGLAWGAAKAFVHKARHR